ncbi:DUF4260 domain-containing protein [Cytobacillus sp. FJAT-54145]|uniref:DUF4260 domain-containing protein n=1 Tax=Cytobacillus spartinae TaxID=3299023 RepID=A0ABW6KK51_9BACI
MNKLFLHIEGLTVLILSITVYAYQDYSWLLFFILLFVPDLSMMGYAFNKKIGALVYNAFHTYSLPILILVLGVVMENQTLLSIGIIWTSHIGMDRVLGYGLKYPTDFKDTHLNRV